MVGADCEDKWDVKWGPRAFVALFIITDRAACFVGALDKMFCNCMSSHISSISIISWRLGSKDK